MYCAMLPWELQQQQEQPPRNYNRYYRQPRDHASPLHHLGVLHQAAAEQKRLAAV
eukprot:CAMPEP_0170169598 /NCGR_PEP_ID=MMETSP0040_2-20121228/2503_1 /TAXON_ID=641309 /ORGANISM="Lotharella oceanica, Strain CCMP622" /LENGTH=54 /DNA_ID=CAMNT_0010408419 /DNA_START=134 /DNA_END=298 /DNA_ORIENTATION=-